jgi:hypothetical protein
MKRVVLESPYQGDLVRNIAYAKACVRDSLLRKEAPIASHLLYPQAGILHEEHPEERALGIAAGLAWLPGAELMALYTDYGMSPGMEAAEQAAKQAGIPVERREILPKIVAARGAWL